MKNDPFKEYLKESEPDKLSKANIWSTAIGLQAVDGLKPSQYLLNTAIRNIEDEITLTEAQSLISSYYNEQPKHEISDRTEEADKVSARIAQVLSEKSFSLTTTEYVSIHRKLFKDIYKFAGQIRDFNITKKEWVLDGASVIYGSASELRASLEYDISREKAFDYRGLSMEAIIKHLSIFISDLWQIHAFGEGNTRTTAVFFIKYLRTLGFNAMNDIFAENAWYFRNALVRANYNNLQNGVHSTTEYLEIFLRNLLLNEKNQLQNRSMHISGLFNAEKPDIEAQKPDIDSQKLDIDSQKPDINALRFIDERLADCTVKTKNYALRLYQSYSEQFFGRSMVVAALGIKESAASELIAKLLQAEIIEPISGHGKGKYKFIFP